MFNLVSLMLEKVGIIVIVAFLLSQMKSFRHIVHGERNVTERIWLIVLFGTFGVISNYTGIEIHLDTIHRVDWITEINPDNAIANTRVMGVVIGGLIGGPIVGIGAGVLAGVHRLTLGGFTAVACAISTLLAGVAAGYYGKKRRKGRKKITPLYAVKIGMILEAVQMLIIVIVAKPFEQAAKLVEIISIPMILVNGFGTLLFMLIIQSMMRDEERARANQTNQAFHIADQTLPYFRQGLNPSSCQQISEIMLQLTDADAVAITDDRQILSHVGAGADHHILNMELATGLTKEVLESGRVAIAQVKEEIYCFQKDCPLQAAIVLPLKVQNKTVGTLKMYFTDPAKLDQVHKELAEGLANLFSTQLELAEAEQQTKLLKDAEIKALQAQIHPHFLFNSINTISVLCRTDVEKARKLLIELSSFFRSNLQGARQMMIPLEKEIEHVKAYLSLEQARFPDVYHLSLHIEPGLNQVLIPPFTLQPLVENAINHAFTRRNHNKGTILIDISSQNKMIHIIVQDNGKGIEEERRRELGHRTVSSKKGTGTALFNIHERLIGIYNGQAQLTIQSELNVGTKIIISIPLHSKGVFEQHVTSIHSR
ncbi:LytS/YhcK type 5TM receptor domain-containing protein [Peribacillus asahii]|uniref:LytS/YhcK type 5TM receptor domain-containing protein n=1 Tax=Peribacillus asahii TaxID=228899 RepID=UPI00381CC993